MVGKSVSSYPLLDKEANLRAGDPICDHYEAKVHCGGDGDGGGGDCDGNGIDHGGDGGNGDGSEVRVFIIFLFFRCINQGKFLLLRMGVIGGLLHKKLHVWLPKTPFVYLIVMRSKKKKKKKKKKT